MTELFMDKEWFGEFFVHLDQYDRRFPGKIAYSPENRVILTYTITGHDVPAESDVVYGILNDGKKCTLLGKFTPQLSGFSVQNGLLTGADCSWGREGIATKIRYAFGISHQRFQRRPMPDAMPYGQHTRR